MSTPIVRTLYRGLLRQASVYGFDDAARQLALARFAEFIPPQVQLSPNGSDDAVDVVRRSFRAECVPEEGGTVAAAVSTRVTLGFSTLRAMGEDEADLALHALWTRFIVPPRKLPQMCVSPGGSWRMLPKRSTPPTALTPKSMVRELRVFVVVSIIIRWAQLQYKARARSGERRPSPSDILATEPLASLDVDTLTHAIRSETQRVTASAQRDIDGFAAEVIRRLERLDIHVADSVKCSLFPTEACALNPPTVNDEARRMAQLRPHLQTIFEIITTVVLGPAKGKAAPAAAAEDAGAAEEPVPAVPRPLSITRNRPIEDAAVADGPEKERRDIMVSEMRLHCLDHVLDTREASEAVAAAFVMSVAVRLGIRRTRLVHRRGQRPSPSAPGESTERASSSDERFVIFVDGPLACEGRGQITGPLVVDLRKRTVMRCSHAVDEATGTTTTETPVLVPAADRRTAVALLRRLKREARKSVEEKEGLMRQTRKLTALHAESTRLPEISLPGGFSSSSTLAGAHAVIRDKASAPFDHNSLARMHAELSAEEDEDPDGDQDFDDFNAGGTADSEDDITVSDTVATLGTLMPPKVLAAYLCSHLLVVGASQSISEGGKKKVNSSVSVPMQDGDGVRFIKAPDPVVLADDDTWRLLRSQIIFLGGLP